MNRAERRARELFNKGHGCDHTFVLLRREGIEISSEIVGAYRDAFDADIILANYLSGVNGDGTPAGEHPIFLMLDYMGGNNAAGEKLREFTSRMSFRRTYGFFGGMRKFDPKGLFRLWSDN